MQRRAVVLEPAHLARTQQRRIVGDELAHEVGAIERDRREDRRLGAARQQIVGGLAAYLAEARRPADHADLVRVAFAVDVGAGIDQALDHRDACRTARPSAARWHCRTCRAS